MEDQTLIKKIPGINDEVDELFAVFDGHGGYLISLFCKVIFPEVLVYNIEYFCLKMQGAFSDSDEEDGTIIKNAIKKSVKDMDLVIKSKVGHMLIAFILLNQNGSKFPESELAQENFKNYIKKLIKIQQ